MKTSVLVLLKILVNLWYSEGTLERSGASASFVELAWISKEQRQSWNLLELESFNMYKNATALIMTILGCSEVDIEVSDVGMETAKSNGCKKMSEDDRNTNSMLAVT